MNMRKLISGIIGLAVGAYFLFNYLNNRSSLALIWAIVLLLAGMYYFFSGMKQDKKDKEA